jgi:alpha-D-ribose 1-methylphosphonate 5-phosphate C-P lyase
MSPSPIPAFDNPKVDHCPSIQLFGAGREKRIYAVPPYTASVSLHLEDKPFEPQRLIGTCDICGSTDSYLDEVITDDRGGRIRVCSDTHFCATRRESRAALHPAGEEGR